MVFPNHNFELLLTQIFSGVQGDLEIGQSAPPKDARFEATRSSVAGSQMTVQDEVTKQGVNLTEAAALKVSALISQEGRDDLRLRVAVQPGGCSGLKYQLYFDERSFDGDVAADFDGVGVVTDKMSSPYLMGATIDFVDTIEKQGFTIDNPNASGSCACGDSFH
jgi:iron-sulfur cluster assembly accessory protein